MIFPGVNVNRSNAAYAILRIFGRSIRSSPTVDQFQKKASSLSLSAKESSP
jgi:hypothetical protein